jgi:hypothetical protein
MAWKAMIGGADRTASIAHAEGVTITKPRNERGTATFSCLPGYLPAINDDVILYEQDGTTPVFQGLVYDRGTEGFTDSFRSPITAVDYSVYGDWCSVSVQYFFGNDDPPTIGAVVVTLDAVLADIVAVLAQYGVTLDAGQATGDVLEPWNWTNVRVSDALRELETKTGWQVKWVGKVLSMVEPGSDTAPFNLSDATPNCLTLDWTETNTNYANRVILTCGPTAAVPTWQTWEQAGGATSWVTDFNAALPNPGIVDLYYSDTHHWKTVQPEGSAGGFFHWNQATHTLSVGPAGSTPTNGWIIRLQYIAQFPFVYVADEDETPVIEFRQAAADVTTLAAAAEMAWGIYYKVHQRLKTITVTTVSPTTLGSLEPGQTIDIDVTARSLDVAAVITQVEIALVSGTHWVYTVTAEGLPPGTGAPTRFSPTALDYWRSLLGGGIGGGSGAASMDTGGSEETAKLSYVQGYLGGSRYHWVRMNREATLPFIETTAEVFAPTVAAA